MLFEIKNYTSMKTALDSLCDFLTEREVHPDQIFDSRLAACEILGNVLRYEQNEAKLHFELADGFIRLTFFSNAPFLPKKVALPELLSEHGRGLFLACSVSENGIEPVEEGNGVRIRIKVIKA